VFDHDDRIAQIAEIDEGVEQPLVVGCADRSRLIEYVHDADQPRADLTREANALRLPSDRVSALRSGEVAETDIAEKTPAGRRFPDDLTAISPRQPAA